MPDQPQQPKDDENQVPCSDGDPGAPGAPVATGQVRKTNLTERARSSVEGDFSRKKLPPQHGPLPQGGPVDPREILNRKKDKT